MAERYWTLTAKVGRQTFRISDAYEDGYDMPILAEGVQKFREELDKLKGGKKAKIVKIPVTHKFFWQNFAKIREDGVITKVK